MNAKQRAMAVKIAKDVLEQLRLKRYIAQSGTYVQVNSNIDYEGQPADPSDLPESFQKAFKENKNLTCDVCALGSAFASLVNIENKCSVEDMDDSKLLKERLQKYFSAENIELMESAFECSIMSLSGEVYDHDDLVASSYEVLDLAISWGCHYDNDEDRLKAIMRNVIRNKGVFKLPKKMLATLKN